MDNLISRQAAIDTSLEFFVEFLGSALHENAQKELIARFHRLPSAQPEIIRCKDCKNSEHWYWDKRRCFLWAESGIGVFDDGFCNYAERRQDE